MEVQTFIGDHLIFSDITDDFFAERNYIMSKDVSFDDNEYRNVKLKIFKLLKSFCELKSIILKNLFNRNE